MSDAFRFLLAFLLVLAFALIPGTVAAGPNSNPLASAERQLAYLDSNGKLPQPNPAPTELTEQEANAYVSSGHVKLPVGVQSVTFQGQPGVITANCRVDFDQLKVGAHSSNPLLSVFSGIHNVVVVAHAHGAGGRGYVQVDSVSLDGIEVPRFVLELFVEKYLQPKYPRVGLESQFGLPDRVDAAVVGVHKLTVTQK
jgi:hypothetical protein